jgi:hypothetical protein
MKAFAVVKSVNDAYKSFGAEALQRIELFKKTPEVKGTVTIGEIEGGEVIMFLLMIIKIHHFPNSNNTLKPINTCPICQGQNKPKQKV